MTSGVFAAKALSRSWFSADGPPTRAAAGSSSRRRSIVAPLASVEGPVVGTASIKTRPSPPGTGVATEAMPASARRTATVAARSARGTITCRVPGAPAPKAALTWR